MDRILVLGKINMDIAVRVKQFPKGNEEIQMTDTWQRTAGSGYEICHFLKHFSVPCDVCSPVGQGVYAEEIREKLDDSFIRIPSAQMNGCSYTMIDAEGKIQTMFVQGGESDWTGITEVLSDLNPYSAVVVDGSVLIDNEQVIQLLEEYDGQIVLCLDEESVYMDMDILNELLLKDPVIHLTENAAIALCDSEDLEEIGETLKGITENEIVVLGNDLSALYIHGDDKVYQASSPGKHKDMSGVSETHLAAYITAIYSGLRTEKALSFAGSCASLLASSYRTVFSDKEINLQKNLMITSIMK
ncbi:MAG: hypothetical protein IKE36_05745 [Solobacterium sp.]|nr:hypothetical protein [Solobacterium sp.]